MRSSKPFGSLIFRFLVVPVLIATHADVDHIQGLSKLKSLLKAPVLAHKLAAKPLQKGDPILTFAKIEAQKIDLDMPPVTVDRKIEDGEILKIGGLDLEVWVDARSYGQSTLISYGGKFFLVVTTSIAMVALVRLMHTTVAISRSSLNH